MLALGGMFVVHVFEGSFTFVSQYNTPYTGYVSGSRRLLITRRSYKGGVT